MTVISKYACDVDVKVTANKRALNLLVAWAYEAADHYDERGLHALAEEARTFARDTYEALNKVGFYS